MWEMKSQKNKPEKAIAIPMAKAMKKEAGISSDFLVTLRIAQNP